MHCNDGTCIPNENVCDTTEDCPGGNDETDCPCLSPNVQCNDGTCIDCEQVCDTTVDCPDGEDEMDCRKFYTTIKI